MKYVARTRLILLFILLNTWAVGQNLWRHKSGTSYGFYNDANSLVITHQYDDALNFNENLAAVKKNGKWGYINASNTTVIPFEYENAWYFTQGLAAVKKNGKWGYINELNSVIIPFSYSDAADFSDGLAWVEKNGSIGFISKDNEVVIPFEYNAATAFESGLAAVQKNGKWGFINKSNTVKIPFNYDNASFVVNGFAPVKFGSFWGYFDTYGNQVTDFVFSDPAEDHTTSKAFGDQYATYCYRQMDKYKKGDLEYGLYQEHLKKAVQIIRLKQTYPSKSDWALLAKYYDRIGDNENYKIAKKNSKDNSGGGGGGKGNFKRPVLYAAIAPVKWITYNKYKHHPFYGELSFKNIGLGARYNVITEYADPYRFGAWRDSEDENYPYSGKEYSGLLVFKKAMEKGLVPIMEVRYGKYNFSPIPVLLVPTSGGGSQMTTIAPQFETIDLSILLNYRKSYSIFFFDIGYSLGIGYKRWDYGFDRELYRTNIKRYDDYDLSPALMPFRFHFRAGLKL